MTVGPLIFSNNFSDIRPICRNLLPEFEEVGNIRTNYQQDLLRMHDICNQINEIRLGP